MLDDWKQAWRQAVENFQREVRDGSAAAPPRVRAMEREIVSASGALLRLDDEIRRTGSDVESEQESERVCRRREELARSAGDEETVRVAADYAARHAERASVLSRKLAALQDERSLLARDIDGMRRLVAEAAPAAGSVGTGDPATDTGAGPAAGAGPGRTGTEPGRGTFDEEAAARDRAFSHLEREARERAAAERLAELKRRMGA